MKASNPSAIVLLGRDNRKTRTNNPHGVHYTHADGSSSEEEDDGFVSFWWTVGVVFKNSKAGGHG